MIKTTKSAKAFLINLKICSSRGKRLEVRGKNSDQTVIENLRGEPFEKGFPLNFISVP